MKNNRKRTKGRKVQVINLYTLNDSGDKIYTGKTKTIRH